jgi:purine-cytosine permease-like protein
LRPAKRGTFHHQEQEEEYDVPSIANLIETHGAELIPESEQYASPKGLFGVFVGAQMCFNLVVLGWLPIRFGLGFWSGECAIAIGLLLGCLLVGPFALLGSRLGTNSAVSSGAYFGNKGRLIGSSLTFFISLGFFALVIWTGADAITGGVARAFHVESGAVIKSGGYLVMGLGSIALAIYGHDKVAAAQRFVAIGLGVLFLLGFVAMLPQFDMNYAGGAYMLGSFWPTWFVAMTTALAVPVSYAPFSNDYARYISPDKHSAFSISLANGAGLYVGCMAVMTFGAFEGSIFDVKLGPIGGMIQGCPTWYLVPVILIGMVGPLTHGALCLYAPGLDLSSFFKRLSRAWVTLAVGLLGMIVVFLGAFVWDAVNAFIAFVTLFTVATTPWIVINLIGYFYQRAKRSKLEGPAARSYAGHGSYRRVADWDLRAVLAWLPAVVVGLLLSQTTLFTGIWSGIAGGIDVSVPAAAILGALIYGGALTIYPEDTALARENVSPGVTPAAVHSIRAVDM